jgi:hypothetical protein
VEIDEKAIYFINFIADFYDIIEVFHKNKKEGKVREKRRAKHRNGIYQILTKTLIKHSKYGIYTFFASVPALPDNNFSRETGVE